MIKKINIFVLFSYILAGSICFASADSNQQAAAVTSAIGTQSEVVTSTIPGQSSVVLPSRLLADEVEKLERKKLGYKPVPFANGRKDMTVDEIVAMALYHLRLKTALEQAQAAMSQDEPKPEEQT